MMARARATLVALESFVRVGTKIRSRRFQCPGCGRFVSKGDMTCEQCGLDLRLRELIPSVRFQCSLDGTFVGATDMFCPHCGADIR